MSALFIGVGRWPDRCSIIQYRAALACGPDRQRRVRRWAKFIEGNFLTPRVVGQRIRLHPVWVMFAVLAGTALFGLVGTFLGTPAAAVIAVFVRFGLDRWRRSGYFAAGGTT